MYCTCFGNYFLLIYYRGRGSNYLLHLGSVYIELGCSRFTFEHGNASYWVEQFLTGAMAKLYLVITSVFLVFHIN